MWSALLLSIQSWHWTRHEALAQLMLYHYRWMFGAQNTYLQYVRSIIVIKLQLKCYLKFDVRKRNRIQLILLAMYVGFGRCSWSTLRSTQIVLRRILQDQIGKSLDGLYLFRSRAMWIMLHLCLPFNSYMQWKLNRHVHKSTLWRSCHTISNGFNCFMPVIFIRLHHS